MTTDQQKTEDQDVRGGIDLATMEGLFEVLDKLIEGLRYTLRAVPAGQEEVAKDTEFMIRGVESVRAELVGQRESLRHQAVEADRILALLDKAQRTGAFPAMEAEIADLREKLAASVPLVRYENALRTTDYAFEEARRSRTLARVTARALEAMKRELDKNVVELTVAKEEHQRACETIAQMHAAAMGEVIGPRLGVVEDVANLRATMVSLSDALERHVKANGELAQAVTDKTWTIQQMEQNRDESLRLYSALEKEREDERWRNAELEAERLKLRTALETALNERDVARREVQSLTADLGGPDERMDLKRRLDASNKDVTRLSMELEAARDENRRLHEEIDASDAAEDSMVPRSEHDCIKTDLGNALRTIDHVAAASHGLLATLDDVQCPHGLSIRSTLAVLTGYRGEAKMVVEDGVNVGGVVMTGETAVLAQSIMALSAKVDTLLDRVDVVEKAVSNELRAVDAEIDKRVRVLESPNLGGVVLAAVDVDDFDGITPVGPRDPNHKR